MSNMLARRDDEEYMEFRNRLTDADTPWENGNRPRS